MKKIALLLTVLITYSSYCQDCKDVIKKYDEFRNSTTLETPLLSRKLNVKFVRITEPGINLSHIGVTFISDKAEENANEFYFKLDNGTIIKLKDIELSYKDYGENQYLIIGSATVGNDVIEKIRKNKITIVRIGTIQKDIDDYMATELLRYANCVFIKEVK